MPSGRHPLPAPKLDKNHINPSYSSPSAKSWLPITWTGETFDAVAGLELLRVRAQGSLDTEAPRGLRNRSHLYIFPPLYIHNELPTSPSLPTQQYLTKACTPHTILFFFEGWCSHTFLGWTCKPGVLSSYFGFAACADLLP